MSSSTVLRVASSPLVRILPTVQLSALDHYMRREESAPRVYGIIFGSASDTAYELSSSFPLRCPDQNKPNTIDAEHLNTVKELVAMAHPTEKIVGWYVVGDTSEFNLQGFQEAFEKLLAKEAVVQGNGLLYVKIDATFDQGQLVCEAYQAIQCTLEADVDVPTPTQYLFTPVPVDVLLHEPERVALETLNRSLSKDDAVTPFVSHLEAVMTSTHKLHSMVQEAIRYVQKVNAGEEEGDARIGAHLKETLAAAPMVDPSSMLHDLLMVVYLAKLTKSQVELHEKLQAVL